MRLQQPRFRVPPAPPSAAAALAAVAAAASLRGAADVPSAAAHGAWAGVWERLDLAPVIGFPIWEAEMHGMLAERALPLLDLFAHYCGRGDDAAGATGERGGVSHRAGAAAGAGDSPPPPVRVGSATSRGGRYNPLLHHKGQPAAPQGFWGIDKKVIHWHASTGQLPPRPWEDEEGLLGRRATDVSAAGDSADGAEAGTASP